MLQNKSINFYRICFEIQVLITWMIALCLARFEIEIESLKWHVILCRSCFIQFVLSNLHTCAYLPRTHLCVGASVCTTHRFRYHNVPLNNIHYSM